MVELLRRRVPWLRHASTARLYPAVHRYALHEWTVTELLDAVERQLRLREWTVPARLRQPEVYLADLLGPIDPIDPPADASPAAATWCGHCDEHTRLIEINDDRVSRCSCHPLSGTR